MAATSVIFSHRLNAITSASAQPALPVADSAGLAFTLKAPPYAGGAAPLHKFIPFSMAMQGAAALLTQAYTQLKRSGPAATVVAYVGLPAVPVATAAFCVEVCMASSDVSVVVVASSGTAPL